MIEILASIEGRHRRTGGPFTAGVVLWDDRVVEAAPIVGYMKRWTRDRVRDHCRDEGWTVSVVWQMDRPDTR